MNPKLLSIVVPMYFEENVVEECYRRLTAVTSASNFDYELIFVNDGSTDMTQQLLEAIALKDKNVKVINFSRNFGHQIAVSAGLDKAKGDAVVIIDADLQDPPELIADMLKLWEKGYDVVYGKRKKRDGESFFKLFTAKMFYRVLNSMSCIPIPMDTGDFRLLDRKVVEVFRKMPEQNRFLRGMSSWIGFKQIAIEYERDERFAGETKYPLKKMLKLASDGILSFSSKPIRFIELIGIIMLFMGLLCSVYLLSSAVIGFKVSNSYWTSLFIAITIIGGLQLFSIGILGEYVTRIYDQSKGRPLYIIEKEINMKRHLYLVGKDTNNQKKYGAE
jgi:dolichol-phosphate mannosyltransferase